MPRDASASSSWQVAPFLLKETISSHDLDVLVVIDYTLLSMGDEARTAWVNLFASSINQFDFTSMFPARWTDRTVCSFQGVKGEYFYLL